MVNQEFTVSPHSIPLDAMTVYAEIHFDQAGQCWRVVVVFSRAPDLLPMQGQDVDARLIDAQGASLEVIERPQKPLAEIHSGLGNSANAFFRFRASGAVPAQLSVTYQGKTVQFRVGVAQGNDA
jgi:hypothetical protein